MIPGWANRGWVSPCPASCAGPTTGGKSGGGNEPQCRRLRGRRAIEICPYTVRGRSARPRDGLPRGGRPLTVLADGGRVQLTVARFVVKHLAFLLLTLLVVSFLVFTLNEFSPGDVARKVLGAYATQEQVDILTRKMGLNRPVLVRYVEFLGRLAAGDLGTSTRFKVPVKDIIWN